MLIDFVGLISDEPKLAERNSSIQVFAIDIDNQNTNKVECCVRANVDTVAMIPMYPQLFFHIPVTDSELQCENSIAVYEIQLISTSDNRIFIEVLSDVESFCSLVLSRYEVEKKIKELNWEVVAEKSMLLTA